MADKPILFSAPMVKALLAGTKTQTRRYFSADPYLEAVERTATQGWRFILKPGAELSVKPPRIMVGDRLYVRETWSGIHAFRNTPPAQRESMMTPDGPLLREDVWFWADGNPDGGDYEKPRPGMHMPRWASRLTLTVTDVRVERLQDISEQDAWAEGCAKGAPDDVGGFFPAEEADPSGVGYRGWDNARDWYADLWDQINGEDAWEANPWVAAYTFTVEHGNIDQLARAA